MFRGYPDKSTAIKALEEAEKLNPGEWKQHSEYDVLPNVIQNTFSNK